MTSCVRWHVPLQKSGKSTDTMRALTIRHLLQVRHSALLQVNPMPCPGATVVYAFFCVFRHQCFGGETPQLDSQETESQQGDTFTVDGHELGTVR